MGSSRQEYWSGLPFPSPGDLPNPGIECGSPALQADALTSKPPGKPLCYEVHCNLVTESSASLYTGVELNPRDRILGEVEKDSFIALPGKGRHGGFCFVKLCLTSKELDEGFYNNGSKVGSLTRSGLGLL